MRKKTFVLYDPGLGFQRYFLLSFRFDNNGFSFEFCMNPDKALKFDDLMLATLCDMFASFAAEECPFVPYYFECVPNLNLNKVR